MPQCAALSILGASFYFLAATSRSYMRRFFLQVPPRSPPLAPPALRPAPPRLAPLLLEYTTAPCYTAPRPYPQLPPLAVVDLEPARPEDDVG